MAQQVKNPPPIQVTRKMRVGTLGREDSLEEGIATHSRVLVWRIPWTEELGRLESKVSRKVGHNWVTKCVHTHTHTHTQFPNSLYLSITTYLCSIELTCVCVKGMSVLPFSACKIHAQVVMFINVSLSTGFGTKAMAPHSSTLAWQIPWMEEPGRLQSIGSLRVRYDWETSLSLFTFLHWRRKWQPTPVFLPGESQGWRSPVGCHLRGHTASDTTEVT